MDEKDKKAAGSRDISDLKARLGLKKGPGAPGGPVGTPPPGAPVAGGFSPSPTPAARAIPSPVPAPPGFPAPAESQQAAPSAPAVDPRRDPFAAQQAAQQQAAQQAAYYGYMPLPGTDDGEPVAPISQPKAWGTIALAALVALVVYGAGWGCGSIRYARGNMNRTIDQAGEIRVEVDRMGKVLSTINDRINQSTEAAKGNPDTQLAADLGSLELKKPDQEKIFHTNYYFMKDLAIDRLFNYYNDTIILYELIAKNTKKTDADHEAIENFVKNAKESAEKNFGVTIDITGAIPLAHFAEMGGPVCPVEGQVDCKATELKGFKFRTESGGTWSVKPVKGAMNTIIIPIQKTPLFATVASGSPDVIAVKEHLRRMAEIRLLTAKLFQEQKELLVDLEGQAAQKKVKENFIF